MNPVDAKGATLYVEDQVAELTHRGRLARIISFPAPGKVFTTSGLTTRCDLVEYRP